MLTVEELRGSLEQIEETDVEAIRGLVAEMVRNRIRLGDLERKEDGSVNVIKTALFVHITAVLNRTACIPLDIGAYVNKLIFRASLLQKLGYQLVWRSQVSDDGRDGCSRKITLKKEGTEEELSLVTSWEAYAGGSMRLRSASSELLEALQAYFVQFDWLKASVSDDTLFVSESRER